jgi:hypothetical protein
MLALVEEKAKSLRSVAPMPAPFEREPKRGDVDDAALRSPRTPLCGDELSHQPNGRSEGLKPRRLPLLCGDAAHVPVQATAALGAAAAEDRVSLNAGCQRPTAIIVSAKPTEPSIILASHDFRLVVPKRGQRALSMRLTALVRGVNRNRRRDAVHNQNLRSL